MDLLKFEGQPDEFKAAVESMKRECESMCDSQAIFAKIQKAKYDACIEEGFTEAQALELCKRIGV